MKLFLWFALWFSIIGGAAAAVVAAGYFIVLYPGIPAAIAILWVLFKGKKH